MKYVYKTILTKEIITLTKQVSKQGQNNRKAYQCNFGRHGETRRIIRSFQNTYE